MINRLVISICIGSSLLGFAQVASAYGPLTHVYVIYRQRENICTTVERWYPQACKQDRERVIAAAMAGALLHDVGYVDDQLIEFTNLLHYQGTGEFVDLFVSNMIRYGRPDSIAFALGALGHYAGDRQGHYWATNRISAHLLNTKDVKGSGLSYEDNESCHSCIEGALDSLVAEQMSEEDLRTFLRTLDSLARFVSDPEFQFPKLGEDLRGALTELYGIAVAAFGGMEQADWWYKKIIPAYQQLLLRMDLALREAQALYGLDFQLDKRTFWAKALWTGGKILLSSCGNLADRVRNSYESRRWLWISLSKTNDLYSKYLLAISQAARQQNSGPLSVWQKGERPGSINLDTNLVSASGEYVLADLTAVYLRNNRDKMKSTSLRFLEEYERLGAARKSIYFDLASLANRSELDQQIHSLDAMEKEMNSATALGGKVQWQLPGNMPRFYEIGNSLCSQPNLVTLSLSSNRQTKVGPMLVCLPTDAIVLEAWLGAIAAGWSQQASRNEPLPQELLNHLHQFYIETQYGYSHNGEKEREKLNSLCKSAIN